MKIKINYTKCIINVLIILWLMSMCFKVGYEVAVIVTNAQVLNCVKSGKSFVCKLGYEVAK